jgi:FkbM family methyltransferase
VTSDWLRALKRAAHRTANLFGRELSRDFETGRLSLKRYSDLGADRFLAIRTILGRDPSVIFDIGAHVGQTAIELSGHFPQARIFSFEPTPATFATLCQAVAHLPNVEPVQLAVSDFDGRATLNLNAFDLTNSLLVTADRAAQFVLSPRMLETRGTVDVQTATVETFCRGRGIRSIDLLKSDAQGLDLKVIEGAGSLLGTTIPLIYLELNFVESYSDQPLFDQVYRRLYGRGYRLVDLYETGFRTHFYQLSCNGLFVHESYGRNPVNHTRIK